MPLLPEGAVDLGLLLPGLSAPVEVVRDREGVPHIFATSREDLFSALGFGSMHILTLLEGRPPRVRTIGNEVYRSDDAGKTWQNMGLQDTQHIGRILIHPKDPNTVYVGGLPIAKSLDGGRTFVTLNEDGLGGDPGHVGRPREGAIG